MQKISFKDLPEEINLMMHLIKDELLYKLYSKITFLYFPFHIIKENIYGAYNNDEIQSQASDFLLDYLKHFRFFTYYLDQFHSFTKSSINSAKTTISESNINAFVCVEKQCLIIEQIDFAFFDQIISKLKKNNILVLNLSGSNFNSCPTAEEKQSFEEIKNFCFHFQMSLNHNIFVKKTIVPIAGYMIRRYYCPSEYFKDQSFFAFNHQSNLKTKNIYEKIKDIFFIDQPIENYIAQMFVEITNYSENCTCIVKKKFKENDFIFLRTIHTNGKANFNLVIHRESFYLLMIKYVVSTENLNQIKHEIDFCKSFSNRCMVPFYGFVEKKGEIIGFVYEFMSNGSLDFYLSRKKQDNEVFIMMTINRLCQCIYYLHSNFLVHRDLKPSNILINHDFLPFVCDFETINKPIDEIDFLNGVEISTNMITPLYSSPEQDSGGYVSYPSDIYSFGLIIYYLFEKNDMWSTEILAKSSKSLHKVKPMKNGSRNIKNIYEDCVKLSSKERPRITEIIEKLIDEFCYAQNKPIQYNDYSMLEKDKILAENIIILKIKYEDIINNTKRSENEGTYNKTDIFYALAHFFENGIVFQKDSLKAIEFYEISSQSKNPDSLFNLGVKYFNGDNVDKNISKSIEYFEAAAQLNHHHSLNNMGYFYLNGIGVKKDYQKAKKYFELSANQNNSAALYNLGYIFLYGKGLKKDYAMAFKYFKLASNLNNPHALNSLGICYDKGYGVDRNYSKAKEYFELSAKQNNSFAMINLSYLYKNGFGVERDIPRARHYLELAAQQQNPFAYLNLGDLYKDLSEPDYSKARYYYEIASKLNITESYNRLGDIYKNGLGVEQDYLKARDYYEISASFNNQNAYFELGELYKKGLGVNVNYLYAKYYYESSARLGNPAAFFNLAEFNSNSDFFDSNHENAIKYYMKCIEIPNKYIKLYDKEQNKFVFSYRCNNYTYHSYNNIGLIYITVFEDIEKAETYIKEAAFAEYPFAQNNYGLFLQFYANKIDNAKYMYERASKHKFAIAEYNLGHFYEEKGDITKSIEYYSKASEDESEPLVFRGNQHSDKRLEISKIFIICFTNLKLVEIFLSQSNDEKAKKYFIRSFAILIKNDSNYRFQFCFLSNKKKKNIFSYMKDFILNFPLFNLKNNRNIIQSVFIDGESMKIIKDDVTENQLNDKYLSIEKQKFVKKEGEILDFDDMLDGISHNIFDSSSDLFDYVIQNNDLKKEFIDEIKDIINEMNMILYSKPLSILFGRIEISKKIKEKSIFLKDINDAFYNGFGLS